MVAVVDREEKQIDREKYRGQWIAIKNDEVVAAAATPDEVIRQIEELGIVGWVLDRVPENPDSIFIL